ncbi:MAG: hypothetical protein K5669_06390 [Lachnospiraceae bacterium]|nr:hypothetical protein [Lachnospiraceae bacterium]
MKMKKAVAVILCSAMLACSCCGCSAIDGIGSEIGEKVVTKSEEEILESVVSKVANAGVSEAMKEETVYVKTDACGNTTSVIVSNHLKNADMTSKLEDETILTDIVNVKGKETYKTEGNKLIWDAEGSDIYYQGTTDKKLPIDVNVTYELDSKMIDPKDMNGKNGHVVITINYKNNALNTVNINGRDETIYTPFAAVSAFTLDEKKFKDVKVEGGTVVSDGKRNLVVGMAFPGLVDSLNGGKSADSELMETIEDEFKIQDKIVVEADVTDFEPGMMVTLVTSNITGALGLDSFNLDSDGKLDDIEDKMDDFKDAGAKLVDGTGELKDGAQKLADGSGSLADGSNTLYNGIVEYTNGVGQIASGAGELNSKMAELNLGCASIKSGVDTLVSEVGSMAGGIGNAALAAGQISDGINQVVAATSVATDPASIDTSSISVTGTVSGDVAAAAMMQYITADQLTAAGLSAEQAQAVLSMVSTVSSQVIPGIVDNATDATAKQVAAQAAANGANETKSLINAALTTAGENGQSLQSGAASLSEGLAQSAASLNTSDVQSKISELSSGASALAEGAQKLSEGSAKLADGASKLNASSGALINGSKSLADGSAQLAGGADSLLSGCVKLNSGMVEFNKEGIDKLTDLFDTDYVSMKERIKAISDLGKSYNSFAGAGENEDCSVKFIIETEEIKL